MSEDKPRITYAEAEAVRITLQVLTAEVNTETIGPVSVPDRRDDDGAEG